jgi:hypothetical protein
MNSKGVGFGDEIGVTVFICSVPEFHKFFVYFFAMADVIHREDSMICTVTKAPFKNTRL